MRLQPSVVKIHSMFSLVYIFGWTQSAESTASELVDAANEEIKKME